MDQYNVFETRYYGDTLILKGFDLFVQLCWREWLFDWKQILFVSLLW